MSDGITVQITPDLISAMESVKTMVFNAVFQYSEWLDSEGLLAAPDVADTRTHDDLVKEFYDNDSPRQRSTWHTRRSA